MKKLVLGFMLLAFVLALSGCGVKSVSESQIQQDVENYERFAPLCVSVSDFEIIKRQTNPDKKTDIIYVSVCGENEDYSVIRNYIVKYVLYNDGWMLENIEPYANDEKPDETVPLHGVPCEQVREDLKGLKGCFGFSSFPEDRIQDILISDESDQLAAEYLPVDEFGMCRFEQEVKFKLYTFYEIITIPVVYNFYGSDEEMDSWGWHPTVEDWNIDRRAELHEGILGLWSHPVDWLKEDGDVLISSYSATSCHADSFSLYGRAEYDQIPLDFELRYTLGENALRPSVWLTCPEWGKYGPRIELYCFDDRISMQYNTYHTGAWYKL